MRFRHFFLTALLLAAVAYGQTVPTLLDAKGVVKNAITALPTLSGQLRAVHKMQRWLTGVENAVLKKIETERTIRAVPALNATAKQALRDAAQAELDAASNNMDAEQAAAEGEEI